jgi:phosphate transport system ATP-binding protein
MQPVIKIRNLNVTSPKTHILKNINLDIYRGELLCLIGPAASGKTTLLRCINRLSDFDKTLKIEGEIIFDGKNIWDKDVDVANLRTKIGMVFAVPTPLPKTIFENLVLGPRFTGKTRMLMELVEKCLRDVYMWDEVKDRLNDSSLTLSGGQQQRLCLARILMLQPDVLLLDEATSGLDPVSTTKIEEALNELKKRIAILFVTNNVLQAARISDKTGFLLMGEMVEIDETRKLFVNPKDRRTRDYITGKFG